MNLSFKIVESVDKQTSDNQNNKRVKKTTKFTDKLILAAIVHKKCAFGSSSMDNFLSNELVSLKKI